MQHACACNDVLPPRVARCARRALVQLIDFEGRRLPAGQRVGCVAERIVAALLAAFGKDGARPLDDPAVAAHDVLAIAKDIVDVDAVCERGEAGTAALETRVLYCVRLFARNVRWTACVSAGFRANLRGAASDRPKPRRAGHA
ncbi:hypothetical protein WS69_21565 [Burkholderia sp. BDU5]|nr:hypothetical protein WS69_21565 [Burkholderia sp. BDU5]